MALDLFSNFIIEHGSAVVQAKHIALLKEKFTILLSENATLTTKNATLTAENEVLKAENVTLKNENIDLKQHIAGIEEQHDPANDPCPYCHQRKGQLMELTPHKIYGDSGFKVGLYQCTNCGKQYEKEHAP